MKVLFIRSLQVELLNSLTQNLIKQGYIIDILDNQKQYKNLGNFYRNIILTKKIGDYKITNLSFKNICKIRKEKYEEVYIFHKQEGIHGFQNIIFMCLFFDVKKIYSLKFDHNDIDLKNSKLIKKSIIIKFIYIYIISFLFLPFVIIIICFLILFSWFKSILKKSENR